MQIVTFGAHVLDVVAHPVDEIPEGQGAVLVPQIRLVPAGPAGGTAVALAKLGAAVSTVGAIGTDDSGDLLTHPPATARRGHRTSCARAGSVDIDERAAHPQQR